MEKIVKGGLLSAAAGAVFVVGMGLSGAAYAQDSELSDIFGDDITEAETAPADASAQTATTEGAASDEDAAPKTSGRRMLMDEVVVSAQRREEDVRDVPMSMSVMSGEDMRDAGVTQFNDLALFVPNISINTDWFSLYMRGVGTSEVNVMAEQAVAYMFDDVYAARVEVLRSGFLDVERMEVLKGPQGVLFGRNSPAGVINITQGAPEYEWHARFEGSLGEIETKELRGMVTGPIIEDKLAFRLAVSWDENGPHTENVFDPNVRIGGREAMRARAKLLWDVTEDLAVTVSGEYFDYDLGQWGATEETYTPEEWKTIFRTQDPNFEDNFDRRGSSRDGASAVGDGMMFSIKADLDIWDHTFSSVTGYIEYSDVSGGDIEMTAFPLIEFGYENDYWQWTEELKVISPPGDIEYIGGLFAFKSYADAYGRGLLLRDVDTEMLQAIVAPDALAGAFDAIENLLVGGNLTAYEGDLIYCICLLDTLSLAGFGQVTWHITDALSVMAGGRYTWEKKKFHATLAVEDPSPLWGTLLFDERGYDIRPKTTYRDFSPKVSITWEAMEEISLYATYAQGFRSGSFNVASFRQEDAEFDPESSTTYEAGVKTAFFDGLARFNVSLFWTDYKDYQVTTFETITFESSNAEEVRVRGLEADFTVSPIEPLVLVGSLGYNDASYVKYTEGSCPTLFYTDTSGTGTCALPQGPVNTPPETSQDLSGRQLFRAPRWTGSLNAIFAWPVESINSLFILAGSATFRSREFIDPDLDPLDSQDEHWLYGARIGIRNIDNIWSFEIQGKNLTDEIVKITSFDAPIAVGAHMAQSNKPRQVIARMRVEF